MFLVNRLFTKHLSLVTDDQEQSDIERGAASQGLRRHDELVCTFW